MPTTLAAIRTGGRARETRGHTPAAEPRWAALPGAGTGDAARRTAALGPVSERGTTGAAWRCGSGVAPVRERRGQPTWSRWRSCWPTCLRQSCHASAGESGQHACWATAYARSPRARGTSHQAAVRAVAFQGIRSSDTGGQTRTPDSDRRSVERLRKKGAPRLACAANQPS
jgi:hypothetical protein